MEELTAVRIDVPFDDERLPQDETWDRTPAIAFDADWRGQSQSPERATSVRFLWSSTRLYVRFQCRYRQIYVYEGGGGRRDQLWLRDVAELFIRPGEDAPTHYREFEVSPNGDWLDLDIEPGRKTILMCDMRVRVVVDKATRLWTADLGIPFTCLTAAFDPREIWRLNLFRIEGPEPSRFYSAWRPTRTPKPNFHVPDAFGSLRFEQ